MIFSIINKITTDYKYLFIINCKIDKECESKFIPSFATNKPIGYFVKSINDVTDIIKEIFLVWRHEYHSNPSEHVRKANLEYMEQIIQKIHDLKFFPYLDFNIGSGNGPSFDSNCWFKVFPMRKEFINLLDLTYEENKPELINKKNYVHRIIPYVVYKDHNPNRLRVHITQNSDYITKGINQTFLLVRDIFDLEFYVSHFERLGLTIKNPQYFINLIKSGKSFLLTEDDFKNTNEILYAHVYFLTPINESVTTIQQNLYHIKTDYIIKISEDLFYPKITHSDVGCKIMSFL